MWEINKIIERKKFTDVDKEVERTDLKINTGKNQY